MYCDIFYSIATGDKKDILETQKKYSAILPFLKGHWLKQ